MFFFFCFIAWIRLFCSNYKSLTTPAYILSLFIINSVRIAAVQQFLPHLTGSDDSNTARPKMDQQMIASLPNLFCLKNPLDITLDTSKKSVLKV